MGGEFEVGAGGEGGPLGGQWQGRKTIWQRTYNAECFDALVQAVLGAL
jgi:hypothetical protein